MIVSICTAYFVHSVASLVARSGSARLNSGSVEAGIVATMHGTGMSEAHVSSRVVVRNFYVVEIDMCDFIEELAVKELVRFIYQK